MNILDFFFNDKNPVLMIEITLWGVTLSGSIFFIIISLIIHFKKYFISSKSRDFLDMGEHQQKQGTPTMGGMAFYLVLPILYFFYQGNMKFWFIAITSGLSGIVGGVDDWYKINFGVGLTVRVKFILQMICALSSGVFFYYSFPGESFINFFGYHFDLGMYYIFWIMWVIMATTHAVNLIDGIDGLAISQILIMQIFSSLSIFFGKISILISVFWYHFFIVNRYKAKIFMGDVGAFFLGGYLASVFIVARCELLLVVAGIIFVINTLMVIQQTIYYRLYKLRFFSFTPYHHALEKKGWSENKICLVYGLVTCFGSIFSKILYYKYF